MPREHKGGMRDYLSMGKLEKVLREKVKYKQESFLDGQLFAEESYYMQSLRRLEGREGGTACFKSSTGKGKEMKENRRKGQRYSQT